MPFLLRLAVPTMSSLAKHATRGRNRQFCNRALARFRSLHRSECITRCHTQLETDVRRLAVTTTATLMLAVAIANPALANLEVCEVLTTRVDTAD